MSQFDYQSIIEACGIQDVNIKSALDEKNKSVVKFQQQFDILKKLIEEKDKKYKNLSNLKFLLDKNVQRVNKMHKKLSNFNKEYKIVQDEVTQLNLKLQQKSIDFVKEMTKMDNRLKEQYIQFQRETLINLLSDLTDEQHSMQHNEARLENNYKELSKRSNDLSGYERPDILKEIMADMPKHENLKEIEKKLANKKRNIQFLTAEYKKKKDLLQKLT